MSLPTDQGIPGSISGLFVGFSPVKNYSTVFNNILRRKANSIGYILRSCLLHNGHSIEVKGVGRTKKDPFDDCSGESLRASPNL